MLVIVICIYSIIAHMFWIKRQKKLDDEVLGVQDNIQHNIQNN